MLNLILPLVLGLLPYHAIAQNATCVSDVGYSWMYNSLSQSPCDIAAELGGVCTGGSFYVQALTGDRTLAYPGPSADTATSCRCNTVYYSLIAACSLCQEHDFVRFSSFTSNCLTVYSQQFPETIPEDTAVPHYAYLDISSSDNFNVANARAAGGPESSSPPRSTLYVPSTISAPTSTTIQSTTSSPTVSPSSSSTAVNAKKTNVGAIAGGVSGGIAGLAVLGVLVFLLLRRPPPPAPSTPAQDPMMAQSPSSFGFSPYSSSPPPPGSPPMFPSNYSSPTPSAAIGLPQQYPPFYASQVPTNYTGNTATSFTSGRPQYSGFPEL